MAPLAPPGYAYAFAPPGKFSAYAAGANVSLFLLKSDIGFQYVRFKFALAANDLSVKRLKPSITIYPLLGFLCLQSADCRYGSPGTRHNKAKQAIDSPHPRMT